MQIIRRLPDYKWNLVRDYIVRELKPKAKQEQAKCARGRYNLWLNAEPDYRSKKYKSAHTDDRLWQFIRLCTTPTVGLAQVYFAVNGIGIDWHRDAAYCTPEAYIINLGNVRLESKSPKGQVIKLDLVGGEIIQFNAKWLHRAIPKDDQRIGIGVWHDHISLSDKTNWL